MCRVMCEQNTERGIRHCGETKTDSANLLRLALSRAISGILQRVDSSVLRPSVPGALIIDTICDILYVALEL